jgi:hypothetical protein
MKRILIDLKGTARVDPAPMKKALELVQKTKAEIAGAARRRSALEIEVKEYLETCDPDDHKAIQYASGKRMQLEILPNLIARAERVLDTKLVPALEREVDVFKSGLKQFYASAHDIAAKEIATLFRPYFASTHSLGGELQDRALAIAQQTDDCAAIMQRLSEAERISLPHDCRSNNSDKFDRGLCEAAMALLALAERT